MFFSVFSLRAVHHVHQIHQAPGTPCRSKIINRFRVDCFSQTIHPCLTCPDRQAAGFGTRMRGRWVFVQDGHVLPTCHRTHVNAPSRAFRVGCHKPRAQRHEDAMKGRFCGFRLERDDPDEALAFVWVCQRTASARTFLHPPFRTDMRALPKNNPRKDDYLSSWAVFFVPLPDECDERDAPPLRKTLRKTPNSENRFIRFITL